MLKVKNNLRTAVVCVVIALACLFGYIILQNLCAELFIRWGWEVRRVTDLFKYGFWVTFLVVGILFPILEELFFRLLGCKLLKLIKMPDWAVIIITAILFAVYHGSWSQTVYQLLMGIWLAWIFIKTKNIGWTMLIHVINNTYIITYTYLAGTGNDAFDLTAWNIILSVGLAIITTVAVFFLIKKGIPNHEE
ncbi:MAG: CPBP family intramembrane metalloprotease [Clostridia bacterium]|nr:CPBP family intramembrane metalloprotease [Clostridia bacterium]